MRWRVQFVLACPLAHTETDHTTEYQFTNYCRPTDALLTRP